MIRKNISGRSMVEMLAVLAIIGILTIIGVGLYVAALNSNKARQTLQEVARRSFLVPAQDEKYYTRGADHEFLFVGLPESGRKGQFYPLYTMGSDKEDYAYRIIVGDNSIRVSESVCKDIIELQGQIKFAAIFVNDTQYTGNDNICSSNGNQMTFYFDKGFGKNASGGSGGSGGGSSGGDYDCGQDPDDCSANQWFNAGTSCCVSCETAEMAENILHEECCLAVNGVWQNGECQCSSCQRWHDQLKKCVNDLGGKIVTDDGVCYPCQAENSSVASTKEQCAACPANTRFSGNKELDTETNLCYTCDFMPDNHANRAITTKEECQKCPNRYFDGGACHPCVGEVINGTACDWKCDEGYVGEERGCLECDSDDAIYRVSTLESCRGCDNRYYSGKNEYGGYCRLCSALIRSSGGTPNVRKEDCEKCPDTYWLNKDGGRCYYCFYNTHYEDVAEITQQRCCESDKVGGQWINGACQCADCKVWNAEKQTCEVSSESVNACGTSCYNPETEGCCNESEVYDLATQKCCDTGSVVNQEGGCCGEVINGMCTDGFCVYEFDASVKADALMYKDSCYYTYTAPSSYPNEGTLTQIVGCSSGQYCHLYYQGAECVSTIGSASYTNLFGRCIDLETTTDSIDAKCSNEREVNETTGSGLVYANMVKERKGCGGGQYCYLHWTDDSCTDLTNAGDDYLFGTCQDLEQYAPFNQNQCPTESEGE